MSDHVILDLDGMKTVSNSLNQEKTRVEEIFNQDIVEIILNSEDCITKQGLNYEEYCGEIGELFDKFNVLPFIREGFGIFHVEGDEAVFDEVIQFLKAKGAVL